MTALKGRHVFSIGFYYRCARAHVSCRWSERLRTCWGCQTRRRFRDSRDVIVIAALLWRHAAERWASPRRITHTVQRTIVLRSFDDDARKRVHAADAGGRRTGTCRNGSARTAPNFRRYFRCVSADGGRSTSGEEFLARRRAGWDDERQRVDDHHDDSGEDGRQPAASGSGRPGSELPDAGRAATVGPFAAVAAAGYASRQLGVRSVGDVARQAASQVSIVSATLDQPTATKLHPHTLAAFHAGLPGTLTVKRPLIQPNPILSVVGKSESRFDLNRDWITHESIYIYSYILQNRCLYCLIRRWYITNCPVRPRCWSTIKICRTRTALHFGSAVLEYLHNLQWRVILK